MTFNDLAQWVECLTSNRWVPVSREFEPHQRLPLFPHCLVLVGSRNRFERDLR